MSRSDQAQIRTAEPDGRLTILWVDCFPQGFKSHFSHLSIAQSSYRSMTRSSRSACYTPTHQSSPDQESSLYVNTTSPPASFLSALGTLQTASHPNCLDRMTKSNLSVPAELETLCTEVAHLRRLVGRLDSKLDPISEVHSRSAGQVITLQRRPSPVADPRI